MSQSTQYLVSEYMRSAEAMDLTESTREQKERIFREIGAVFPTIDSFDADKYRLYLLKSGRKKVSVNSYVKMARPIFKWAIRQGWIADDPFDGVRNFRLPQERINVYKPCQIDAMLDSANTIWRARIMAAVTAGLRRSEVLNLTLDDIDFENAEIHVQPKHDNIDTWQWYPKNKRCRTVPLSTELHNLLVSMVIPSLPVGQQYLMLSHTRYWDLQRARPLPYRLRLCPDENFTKPYKRIIEQANWNLDVFDKIKNRTFHDLRRTCITAWTQNRDLSPQEVQQLAGHASITTTMEYYAAVRTDVCRRASRKTIIGATGLEPATS
jgi:integrase